MSVLGRLGKIIGADEFTKLGRRIAQQDQEIAKLQRIASEYFEVIEQLDRQRDEWKGMYREQALRHQGAQKVLQRCVHTLANQLRQAVRQVNFFRSAAELPAVTEPVSLEQLPDGVPENYAAKLAELEAKLLAQTDGLTERERVRSSS